jgi:hypothetical protein
MQLHLDEIARTVKRGAHAVLLLDRAGWRTTPALDIPKNITLVLLPSRAHLAGIFFHRRRSTACSSMERSIPSYER